MINIPLWCIHFKRNFIPILFLLFTICLILFSQSNIIAVKNALNIWINNVIPSLLPFFMATELLNHTTLPKTIGNLFNKIMRPLFNVPGIGAYALLMGIISGYPVGAKIVTDFRNQDLCTKEEAERLITFTNNSGPLFILGTVGISLFYDTSIGLLLLLTHLLACISVGIIFRFWKRNQIEKRNINTIETTVTAHSLGEVLSQSILSAIHSVVLIGGFIVLFGLILSILQKTYIFNLFYFLLLPCFQLVGIHSEWIIPILTGLLELTNGVVSVAAVTSRNLGMNVIVCAFLLGFGGISIMLQVFSILSKSDISIRPYILGKLLQGTLAAFYTFLLLQHFSYFHYLQI